MSPPPSCAIRAAAPADVRAVLDLIRQLAAYEQRLHMVDNTEAMLHEVLFGPKPAAEALVAERDGRLVGLALFFQNYSTFTGRPGLYLEDLFVVPEVRGEGIGRELLRRLAAIAVERNYARMEWAVLDWNAPAIAFYRKLGAVEMGDWTVYRLAGEALTAFGRTREDA